jgi:hypothetical protein
MVSSTPPLLQEVIFAIVVPPIITLVWWLGSRGLALTLQGGAVSEKTRRRQKRRFWVLLALIYAVVFGMLLYARLRTP